MSMPTPSQYFCTVTLAIGFYAGVSTLCAEPEPKATADPLQADDPGAKWQKVFREMAGDYEIVAADEPARKFTLRSAPVLRWSQPERIADGGAVYVWLDAGRPVVIGTMFAWPLNGKPIVAHEMHALTIGPMRASYQGKDLWQLEKPALEFKRLTRAEAPAMTVAKRLLQMRTLGREFSASSITRETARESELRLLPQPLYRYELKNQPDPLNGLLDGAILSFVQGTDPEVLMILEARRDGDDAFWQYALARFSDRQLVVKHDDAEVWRVAGSTQNDNRAPYFIRSVDYDESAVDGAGGSAKAKE
jgi:hypothetical protein